MSDLRPVGIPITVDGVERQILFTLNAVDEIQETYDLPLEEVIDLLTDKRQATKTIRYIMTVLLNDEAERCPEKNLKKLTEKEVGWRLTENNVMEITVQVLKAYGMSLPEADIEELELPNLKSGSVKK